MNCLQYNPVVCVFSSETILANSECAYHTGMEKKLLGELMSDTYLFIQFTYNYQWR